MLLLVSAVQFSVEKALQRRLLIQVTTGWCFPTQSKCAFIFHLGGQHSLGPVINGARIILMYSSQQQSRLFNGFKFWKDTGKRVRDDENRRRGGQKYLVVFQYGHVFLVFYVVCKDLPHFCPHHKCYMQEPTSSCLVWTSLRYQKQAVSIAINVSRCRLL